MKEKNNKDEVLKARFKSGERSYIMKILESLPNGDVVLIDGSTVEEKDIIEIVKV